MPRQYFNNASSTLAANIGTGATTIEVAAGHGPRFGTPTVADPVRVTLQQGGTIEIMEATARTGDVLTVTRAVEVVRPDTVATAYAFTAGADVQVRNTAASYTGGGGPSPRPVIVGSYAQYLFRGAGSDVNASVGAANQSSNGTITARAYGASPFARQTRAGFVSAAVINSPAGRVIPLGSSAANVAHNEAARYRVGLGVSDATFQSTGAIFAGPRMNGGTPTDPALLTTSPFVCFGNSPGDTTMAIFHSSGGGTVTKIDLGANFPHTASNTDFFIVELYRAPGSNQWEYTVRNIANGAVATGTLTTNIPAGAGDITWHTNRNTVAGTTAVGLDLNSITVETGWVL